MESPQPEDTVPASNARSSPYQNRRQKNLQKYRKHVVSKRERASSLDVDKQQPPKENTSTASGENGDAHGIDNDMNNLKLQTPPASPLRVEGPSNGKLTPLDVVASPTGSSQMGTPTPHRLAEGSPVAAGGSPVFKRRSDIIKRLSKKKGRDVPASPSTDKEVTASRSVMADSTNNNKSGQDNNNNNNCSQEFLSSEEAELSKTTDPALDATNKDEENALKSGPDGDNVENKSESVISDQQLREASSSFDLRSIHDFPTEPIQKVSEAIENSQDPSWDTAKVFFNEYQGASTTSKGNEGSDPMDMFGTADSSSWTAAETASFSRTFETNTGDVFEGEEASSFSGEEKKETPDSPDSDMSSRRLRARMEVTNPLTEFPAVNPDFGYGFPNDIQDEEGQMEDTQAMEETIPKDDEDLLDVKSNDDELDIWKSDSQISKEERLKQYTTPDSINDENSSTCSSDEEEQEDDDYSGTEEDVGYVSHSEEEEAEGEDLLGITEETGMWPIEVTDNAPAFSIAYEAAAQAKGELYLPEDGSASANDKTSMLSVSVDRTLSEYTDERVATSLSKSASSADSEDQKKERHFDEIEESVSLVGVSLVPSFATSGTAADTHKNQNRIGVPPRGPKTSNTNNLPPPPPPPPLTNKRKKKSGSSKDIPLIAPPPAEKLRKWEESKNRPFERIKSVYDNYSDPHNEKQSQKGILSPRGSVGAEQLACADLTFGLGGGLAVALPNDCQEDFVRAVLSPVDTARSNAQPNSAKWVSGSGAPSQSGFSDFVKCGSLEKSLFENDIGASGSMESSYSADDQGLFANVHEPPHLSRKDLSSLKVSQERTEYLRTLTSPSLSYSPKKGKIDAKEGGALTEAGSPSSSPIIPDKRMAEKVALASYAAAMKFEEKYSISHEVESASVASENGGNRSTDKATETTSELPSLFCGDEFQANIEKLAKVEDTAKDFPSLFCGPEIQRDFENNFADIVVSPLRRTRKAEVRDLKGGAFSPWKNAIYAGKMVELSSASTCSSGEGARLLVAKSDTIDTKLYELTKLLSWLSRDVCELENYDVTVSQDEDDVRKELTELLEEDEKLNKLCQVMCDSVNEKIVEENEDRLNRNSQLSPRKALKAFSLDALSKQKSSAVVAANFVSFLHRMSKATGVSSPFGESNPFLLELVSSSLHGIPSPRGNDGRSNMQKIIFSQCAADAIVKFAFCVCGKHFNEGPGRLPEQVAGNASGEASFDIIEASRAANPSPTKKTKDNFFANDFTQRANVVARKKWLVIDAYPSPFEESVKIDPTILAAILSCLGDPVSVCRVKTLNCDCRNFVAQNEQVLMRDAVRLGGMSMHVRPSFWLWVTLDKCGRASTTTMHETSRQKDNAEDTTCEKDDFSALQNAGKEGKWHSVIQRDVARSFGNMPPHKTGARLRNDSIVRALVTWGKNRIMKRGVKGEGNPPSASSEASLGSDSGADGSQAPTDTVSDWGGVSPVASFTGSNSNTGAGDGEDKRRRNDGQESSRGGRRSQDSQSVATDLLVLSGNALTDEMKADLQRKLGFILYALAASHEDVGYCQGMDYVVAHLLRILQDTVRWRAARGTLPPSILSAPKDIRLSNHDTDALSQNMAEVDRTLVVEETVFRVMDTLFTTYNLQHMYWPELRCLKTCCRVFERLIQIKLPVLADHFEHHELNVGLFALGWFQTLFLYLPSMPSATVCHMWDIWLVERSFKIFFRVGTAILFLSQPILLNHELEGMMTYLNTFPDATLLNPDILIACALQIKVTNKMLMEIEAEVSR